MVITVIAMMVNMTFFLLIPGTGSSDNPCRDTYRGNAAFSAPEASALAHYIKTSRDKVYCYIDIHSYGQFLLYPWSYSKDVIAKDTKELVSNNFVVGIHVMLILTVAKFTVTN